MFTVRNRSVARVAVWQAVSAVRRWVYDVTLDTHSYHRFRASLGGLCPTEGKKIGRAARAEQEVGL